MKVQIATGIQRRSHLLNKAEATLSPSFSYSPAWINCSGLAVRT